MEILPGYAYHVKDSYFAFAKDPFLMQNKEDGNYRPTLYCVKDEATDLYWMVPITSQYEKFSAIREKIVNSGKQCKGIVLGEYDGCSVPVKRELQKKIRKNVKSLLALNAKGIKVTFTDITRLETMMKGCRKNEQENEWKEKTGGYKK